MQLAEIQGSATQPANWKMPDADCVPSSPRWRLQWKGAALAVGMMWLFIAAVASFDVYCSIKYEYELLTEELNPIGRWLMELDGGSVSLFMACKFFCNLLALAGLQVLYSIHRPLCITAAGVMTVLQGCVAIVLWL
jgi:hypothetical protein